MRKGFTLAEVIITLAIVGTVAATSLPSVIINTQQQEFKTGLKKAISALNAAIVINIALENESPYENSNLFGYFVRHMNIIKSTSDRRTLFYVTPTEKNQTLNAIFYTSDGMSFEFRGGNTDNKKITLYENRKIKLCTTNIAGNPKYPNEECGGCGSYGLMDNPNNTTKAPCLIQVDVNGDRKPNPANAKCRNSTCAAKNIYKYSDLKTGRLSDVFSIMITESKAIPYGTAAQRAMYQAK